MGEKVCKTENNPGRPNGQPAKVCYFLKIHFFTEFSLSGNVYSYISVILFPLDFPVNVTSRNALPGTTFSSKSLSILCFTLHKYVVEVSEAEE
jgi:hypothetical protein